MDPCDEESSDYGEFRFAREIQIYGKDRGRSSKGSLAVYRKGHHDGRPQLVLRVVSAAAESGSSDDDRSRGTADAMVTDPTSATCEMFQQAFDARQATNAFGSFAGDAVRNDGDPLDTLETWLAEGTSGNGNQSKGTFLAKFVKDRAAIVVTILLFVSDQYPQKQWSATLPRSTDPSASFDPFARSLIRTIQTLQAAVGKANTEVEALKEDRDGYKAQCKLMSEEWVKEKNDLVTNFFELYEGVQAARDQFKEERDKLKRAYDSLRKGSSRLKDPPRTTDHDTEDAMQWEPDSPNVGYPGAEPNVHADTARSSARGSTAYLSARTAQNGRTRKVNRTEMSERDLFQDDDDTSNEDRDVHPQNASHASRGAGSHAVELPTSRASPTASQAGRLSDDTDVEPAGGVARRPAAERLGSKRRPAAAAAKPRTGNSREDEDSDESDESESHVHVRGRRAVSTVSGKRRAGPKTTQRFSSSDDDGDLGDEGPDTKRPSRKAAAVASSKVQAGPKLSRNPRSDSTAVSQASRSPQSAPPSQTPRSDSATVRQASRSTQRVPSRNAREGQALAATGGDDDSTTDDDKDPNRASLESQALAATGGDDDSTTDDDTDPNQARLAGWRAMLQNCPNGSDDDDDVDRSDAKRMPDAKAPARP